MTDVYIIGNGGNSKVVIDICDSLKFNIIGIFDDKIASNVIGTIDDIKNYQKINIINSIGDCIIRHKIYDKLKIINETLINVINEKLLKMKGQICGVKIKP